MKVIEDFKKLENEDQSDHTRKNFIFWTVVLGGSLFLLLLMIFSITKGAVDISYKAVWEAFLDFDKSNSEHLSVIDLRVPRAIASALVGAAFAVSGAIMQGTTRNPLADPGIMGINAGAIFALAICFAFFPEIGYIQVVIFSFIGAAFGVAIVNGVANVSRSGSTSARIVLAGIAVNALFTSLSQGVALVFSVAQSMTFWSVGGVAASNWTQIKIMLPLISIALLVAIFLSPRISIMSLGEDVAKGLGINIKATNILCTIAVLVLAGSSVAIVGAVGFVGLIIPHISKFIVGVDYRRIIPVSAVLGAILMVLADLVARNINPPFETPIGAIISIIGVPFFLYLSNRQRSG